MDLRELRDFNKTAMKSIGDVVAQYPDMSQVVNMYFQQADLPPPPSPGMLGCELIIFELSKCDVIAQVDDRNGSIFFSLKSSFLRLGSNIPF